jgi:hypothetical protein
VTAIVGGVLVFVLMGRQPPWVHGIFGHRWEERERFYVTHGIFKIPETNILESCKCGAVRVLNVAGVSSPEVMTNLIVKNPVEKP